MTISRKMGLLILAIWAAVPTVLLAIVHRKVYIVTLMCFTNTFGALCFLAWGRQTESRFLAERLILALGGIASLAILTFL